MGDKGKPKKKKQIKPAKTETILPNTQTPVVTPKNPNKPTKRKG